jgi:nucleoside-diphosphate-sugar epimerase
VNQPGKIIILGCGYIGTAFARLAQAQGYAVCGVVRSEASRERLESQGVPALVFDIHRDDWQKLPQDFTSVIYCASTGGGGSESYRLAYDSGVKRACAWAEKIGAQHFIFTSSTGVYRQDDDSRVDENSPVGGTENADALCVGEQAVLSSSIPVRRVLRLGGLYGPGRHYLLDQIKRGECLIGGRTNHYINYLHQEDAAQALLAAITRGPSGPRIYNVCDGSPVKKSDLAQWIAQQVGAGEIIFDQEAPGGPRQRRGALSQPSRRVDNSRIRQELDWKPLYSTVFDGLRAFL